MSVEGSTERAGSLAYASLIWEDWLRFWGHVNRANRGIDECWPWDAGAKREGHGEFRISKDPPLKVPAHRLAWIFANGDELTSADVIAHRCDNPPCCNPLHLFKTDHLGNRMDCVRKERQAKGEANGRARLTEDDVRTIRALSTAGHSSVSLGQMYGVHQSTIAAIVTGKTWRHVGVAA